MGGTGENLSKVDMCIKNGKIVTPTHVYEASIGIGGGRIISISTTPPPSEQSIDAKGKFILPGFIDAHTHIYSPGRLKDNFETGTKAAAYGGVTTLIDMPSLDEFLTTTVRAFERKREIAEKTALIDFALHGGEIMNEENLAEVQALVDVGATAFKIMMGGDPAIENDGVLLEAFSQIGKAGSIAMVHAESQSILTYLRRKLREEGRKNPQAYLDSRPEIVELEAISRAILLADYVGCRLHICHMSTASGVELLREAKGKGRKVTGETCPQYLLLSEEDANRNGVKLMINPPLKKVRDSEGLWLGLAEGIMDIVATDHCAHSTEDKNKGMEDIWQTPVGVPGLETFPRLMLSEGVNKGRLTLQRLVEVASLTPAMIFGLYPRKGTIAVGSDADLLVVDMAREETITADSLLCQSDYTPYEEWKIKGVPELVLVRGSIVAEDGKVVGKSGYGQFITPESTYPHGFNR